MTQDVGAQGVPLGVATATLEIEVGQLVRAERTLTATIQNIARAQQLLLQGDKALQDSAKQTLQVLQQQQRASRGTPAQAKQQEVQATTKILDAEQEINETLLARVRIVEANRRAQELLKQQIEQQNAALKNQAFSLREIASRAGLAAQAAPSRENPGSFVGQLRGAFGQQQSGGRGGFGQGNPNIPTFAQFGLFPFAGLAGSFGATGLQQGILGASSALGVAELGSFRNAITRLAAQLQGIGGVFGALANTGENAAVKLGARGGGLVASLASIGTVVAPIALITGAIAALIQVIGTWQEKIQNVTQTIQDFNQQVAEGATSGDLRGQRNTAERRRQLDTESRDAFVQLLADAQAATPQGFVDQAELNRRFSPLNQRLSALTGGQFTDLSDPSTQIAIQNIVGNFNSSIETLGQTVAQNEARLNSAAVAQNDAAAAADRLAQAQLAAAESTKTLTNAQIQQRIDSLGNQLAGIGQILATNVNISDQYRDELAQQAQGIVAEIQALDQLKSPFRDFLLGLQSIPEFFKRGVEFARQFVDLSAGFFRNRERQAEDDALADQRREDDRNRNRLRAFEDFGRETQQAEQEQARQRQRLIDDAARADLEATEETAERRQELIDEYAEREAEAEEDHQNRLNKILRDGRTRILEAAARLDARGVLETQRRIADQVAEENEKRTEAREDAQEKLAEQLADLDENLEAQKQKRAEDLQRRLQEMASEFAIQQQRRRDDFALRLQQEDQQRALEDQRQSQDRALRNARQIEDFARQRDALFQHWINLQQIGATGASFVEQTFAGMFNNIAARAAAATGQFYADPIARAGAFATPITQGSGFLFSGQGQFPTQFATGISNVPYDMLASLHAGERVLSPLQNAAYERNGGAPTIQVNINGDLGDNSATAVRDAARDGTMEAYNAYMRQLASQLIGMSGGDPQ